MTIHDNSDVLLRNLARIPEMTRRGKILLLSTTLALVGGGLVAALVSSRRIEGAVPGNAPILSLAAVPDGFLVGTGRGLYRSPDGRRWGVVEAVSGAVAVKGMEAGALVASGGSIYTASGISDLNKVAELAERLVAVGGAPGKVVAATSAGGILLQEGSRFSSLPAAPPRGVLALASSGLDIYAAGVAIGLWVTSDAGRSWQQVLATPVTSIEKETVGAGRTFLGTPGGLLVSDPRVGWRFTSLRVAVNGLALRGQYVFAVSNRILYESSGGDTGWRAIPAVER